MGCYVCTINLLYTYLEPFSSPALLALNRHDVVAVTEPVDYHRHHVHASLVRS